MRTLALALLLSSCSAKVWHAPMTLPADSTGRPLALSAGKVKFTGPVTFTVAAAPGAVATSTSTDNRRAGQKGGAAATAPAAVASATTQPAGVRWWVFVLVAAAAVALAAWLRRKFAFVSWFT